jgi:hypothetical protein
MSEGGAVLLPATALAMPIAVAAAAGFAAVVMVRACGAATAALGTKVASLADELERVTREGHQIEDAAHLWGLAASEVMELNATIRVLTLHYPGVRLPQPLMIEGHTVAELDTLLQRTRPLVREARLVAERDAVRALRTSHAQRFGTTTASPTMAEIIDQFEHARLETLDAGPRRPDPEPHTSGARDGAERVSRLHHRVVALLRDLRPDVLPAERDHVLTEAARARATASLEYLPTYVDHLEQYVPDINGRAERRHQAACYLELLQHQVVADADPVPPRVNEAARELNRVVRGERDLDPALQTVTQAALADVAELAHSRQLRDILEECLKEEGYTVLERFDQDRKSGLRVSKPSWRDEHSADVIIDGATYDAALWQDKPGVSETVQRERCEDLADDIAELPALLRDRGVTATNSHTNRHHRVQHRHDGQSSRKPNATSPTKPKRQERKA